MFLCWLIRKAGFIDLTLTPAGWLVRYQILPASHRRTAAPGGYGPRWLVGCRKVRGWPVRRSDWAPDVPVLTVRVLPTPARQNSATALVNRWVLAAERRRSR
ncbi:MAG: hypothetical protein QOK10_1243 [Pseudonocardiales bacterium]|jgi:hypothetical protein|nr:hypothetical protein [Pseudonocardiales bacterium]